MSGLPKGWASTEMREVAQIVSGGTPPSKDESNFQQVGGIPWLTPADLSGYCNHYIARGARNLSEKGYAACSATKMPIGSILFSSRAPIGYVAIAENEISTNQGFKSFILPDGFSSSFLYYYLKLIKPVAEQMATGTTFKELSGAAAAKLPLLVAPLPEQKRIAYKLDSVLTRVDACRERLDRIPALLKRFRQSILAAATSGRLTVDWRTGFELEVLAEKYPVSREPSEAPNIPSNWSWVAIGDLAEKVTDGVHKKPNYVEEGIPFLTVRNLTAGNGIDFSKTSFVSAADHEEFCRRTFPERGDLLISKDGTLGVVRLVDTDRPFSIFVSLALIKLKDKKFSKYMLYALQSPVLQKQMVGVGTGLLHIHLRDLRQDVVPLPPIDEQHEIVRRVDTLLAFADRLEARYAAARKQVGQLTPALLAKAFRGELVPQDPADEPAAELLKRLAVTRSEAPKTRRGRKVTA